MKSFAEYLTESEKTYFFKIGIAGEIPEGLEDKLETDLQKFALKNLMKFPVLKIYLLKRLDFCY